MSLLFFPHLDKKYEFASSSFVREDHFLGEIILFTLEGLKVSVTVSLYFSNTLYVLPIMLDVHGVFLFPQIKEVRNLASPLSDQLPNFCTDASISRFLRARNWNTEKASKMLKETLKWRLEYRPEAIRWVCMSPYFLF